MTNSTRNWIIAGVVILLLIIGYAAYASKPKVIVPINPTIPATPATKTNWLDLLGSLIKKFTTPSSTIPAYIQVQPIDSSGCDANGYNAIGVKCSGY